MGAQMFDAAIEILKASLPAGLPKVEQRRELFKRLYGLELPAQIFLGSQVRTNYFARARVVLACDVVTLPLVHQIMYPTVGLPQGGMIQFLKCIVGQLNSSASNVLSQVFH